MTPRSHTCPSSHSGSAVFLLASSILLVASSVRADFVDPFATVCSKQAEQWHRLEIDAGNAIRACSDEFKPNEPSLCGYIGYDGNCSRQPDCEDGGVDKVKCPAGASRSGGCCLIPKIFDCSGPNGTCLTTNGGPECQNTCEEIPLPPAPAPAPEPMLPPMPAPLPEEAPLPAPSPVPLAEPLPAPLPVLLAPAVGPALAPLEPAVGPLLAPMEPPAAEPPLAVVPAVMAPADAPEDPGLGTIGTRSFGVAPLEATPEPIAGDSAAAPPAALSCTRAALVATGAVVAAAALL